MAQKRFIEIHDEGALNRQSVYVDTLTGVNYLLVIYTSRNQGSGLTVLVDADGKPLVTPPEELARLIEADGR